MQTNFERCSPKIASFKILLVAVCVPICSVADVVDQSANESIDSADDLHVRMDVKAMGEYRKSRRDEFAGSLARSELSTEHQELLANVLAKLYVGVPVSSFSETYNDAKLSETDSEITENWRVTDAGYLQNETESTPMDLRFNPLFIALPTPSFVPDSGQLLDESDTEAKFIFKLDKKGKSSSVIEELYWLDSNSDWAMEITAAKHDQSPKTIVLKIESTDIERPDPRLVSQSYEFHYSFVESCGCFAVSKAKAEIEAPEGYEAFIKPGVRSTQSIYSNIKCVEPLQFLLPDLELPFVMGE